MSIKKKKKSISWKIKPIDRRIKNKHPLPSNYPKASFAHFGSYTSYLEVKTDNFSLLG